MSEVVDRWRDRTQGSADDGRLTYSVYQLIQPYPGPESTGSTESTEGD
jgi:hypothetical protein